MNLIRLSEYDPQKKMDRLIKYGVIALLVLLVIDSIITVKVGYHKKPTFWKVFQNASCFFIPIVLVWLGINEAFSGGIIVSTLFITFGVLIGSAFLIFGLKQRKK